MLDGVRASRTLVVAREEPEVILVTGGMMGVTVRPMVVMEAVTVTPVDLVEAGGAGP